MAHDTGMTKENKEHGHPALAMRFAAADALDFCLNVLNRPDGNFPVTLSTISLRRGLITMARSLTNISMRSPGRVSVLT
jgi:hypothetical protein